MTPAQLLSRLKKSDVAPAYLLLGPETYERRRLKQALIAAVSGGEERQDALSQHDLTEVSLAAVLDDARALSLFASERLIWVTNAEAALPRGRGDDDGDGESASGGAAPLADYLKNPSPDVVLVFEAIRFDFEGDDKRKQERVRKFYSAVNDVVELRRFAMDDARAETEALARKNGFRLEPGAAELLAEALGADMGRIAVEIEKLALYAGDKPVSVDDIAALVPDARSTTIFALVNALGRRDRTRALQTLDTLSREGEYLPLALAFLSTQMRMALAAREAGLKSASQVQGHFARMGVPMWGSRADQIYQTMSKFSKTQLEQGLRLIFDADKGLRSARPDDRIIMEQFVLRLTA
ncbi:MAG TPA: DNA polymerase III subunit delta [Bryobacteraceae bacterium]|nr:DNA polymerase III subunit delta [Bryobacteraceae bacterium]